MYCKTCNYALWNLRSRNCPECGSPFVPGDFEFKPNTVQFQCPHCDQTYYGTSPRGLLEPAAFACVSCGTHVHMNEMVLTPAPGVSEEDTVRERMPWLDLKRRRPVRRWFATVGHALTQPSKLITLLPRESSVGRAILFAFITAAIYGILATLPITIMFIGMASSFGGRLPLTSMMFSVASTYLFLFIAGPLIFILVWGLVAHAILCISGKRSAGLGRTYESLCYSSPANLIQVVPCLNFYFFWVGWIWWALNAGIMLAHGQKVHWGRAAIAAASVPVLLMLAIAFSLYSLIFGIAVGPTITGPVVANSPGASVRMIADELLFYHEVNGNFPGHAVQLMTEGSAIPYEFRLANSMGIPAAPIPLADGTLEELNLQPANIRSGFGRNMASQLPDDVIAHRLGDFVFTYHGIDREQADGSLWLLIASEDAAAPTLANAGMTPNITVLQANGTTVEFPPELLDAELAVQNALRAAEGLAPLPHPDDVTHESPARRGDVP